jgi:hypothetical protein
VQHDNRPHTTPHNADGTADSDELATYTDHGISFCRKQLVQSLDGGASKFSLQVALQRLVMPSDGSSSSRRRQT